MSIVTPPPESAPAPTTPSAGLAHSPQRAGRASRRRARELEIVAATRLLFDERGLQEAPIEAIAREVGINKALIYRHFSSKEELYVMTLTSYLSDLAGHLNGVSPALDPVSQLEDGWRRYTDFCLQHPAFPDCGLSLMRRPAHELMESVSEAIWIRLGQSMAGCLDRLSRILAVGVSEGLFTVSDPDFVANYLYTQTLGTMHLARIGVGIRRGPGGVPEPFDIDPLQVQEACIADVLASVGCKRPT